MSGPQRQTDHGLILGLGDDDHTHYLNAARHAATSHSFVDHGSLAGLADDDHTHYHTDARHAALTHSFVDHGALSGLGDDDHTQYHTDGRAATWHTGLSGAHVTNGDSHDHSGGDGAQIDHGGLSGLADDDHPHYTPHIATADNITNRVDSGFYETSTGTTAEGWPVNSSSWQHLLASTHSNGANYYSLQLAGSFYDQDLYHRQTNGSGSTAWALLFDQGNHGRRAYSAHTGNQTGIGAGTTDLTGLSVTFTAVSSHTYRISGFVSDFQRTAGLATDDRHSLDIRNSAGTAYQRAFFTYFNATAGYSGAQYVECLVSGLSGSQTFKLTHSRLSGGATISKRASGSEPSWILVEDIGI